MTRLLLASAALAGAVIAATPASAQLTEETARAAVAPFYDGLTAAPGKDAAALIMRATAPQWVSCGTNDVCEPRDQVAARIAARLKGVPDLKWEIKEILVSGNRATVRGEATGTPAGEFFGVPHGGKSFKIMSIDVHTIEGGKITRSYHIEDWAGAIRQLSAE